ncbi:MAG: acyl-CoA reductase [Clostridiales bacterium]|nr:acyl-CoA reductase [Clostridiales bacterium]
MNLVHGKIIGSDECDAVLERIDEMILETLRKPPLDIDRVINACDVMVKNLGGLGVMKRLPELGISPSLAEMYIGQIRQMFGAEAIRERMRIELGDNFDKPRELTYSHSKATALQSIAPLGVLFHITAGNVDGLPFISLLDGLLTGNINIVKLPQEEGGITIALLEELFEIEPVLKEYVYVFDYSSKDIYAMKRLAQVADAVIVWGGDEAVGAVRKMAEPNTKIIEWGHKISFAYVTREGIKWKNMEKLARHICLTNQLFCSSCQGVFLDTDNMQDIYDFCEEFLPILERACCDDPPALSAAEKLFIQAGITLQNYHNRIEKRKSETRIFESTNCSITASPDSKLETSIMYRNIWAKPLKREDILKLRPYKNYLQTAALICGEEEHRELSQKLLQTGLVKISDGFEMSNYAFGEAHDGIFTLRCYTKLVSVQN